MKRSIVLFVMLATCLVMIGQSTQENSEKYWSYRERLREKFMKIGKNPGEGIPMHSRTIGLAYPGAPEIDSLAPSRVFFSDATVTLGYYMEILATEYFLLIQNPQSNTVEKVATLNEIYYVLNAIDRLDRTAEGYLTQESGNPSDLNGLFLRDDVPSDFHTHFSPDANSDFVPDTVGDDYSKIFNRPSKFIRTDSDAHPMGRYSTDPVGYGENMNVNLGNIMSLDQITGVFSGLRAIYDLIPSNIDVQPTAIDDPRNLHQWAREIFIRIFDYVTPEVPKPPLDEILQEPLQSQLAAVHPRRLFKIRNVDGQLVDKDKGPDLTYVAPMFVRLAEHFEHPNIDEFSTLTRVPLMLNPNDIIASNEVHAFGFPGHEALLELCQDLAADKKPLIIGTISLGALELLLKELDEQSCSFWPKRDLSFTMSPELFVIWNDVDIEIEGLLIDDHLDVAVALLEVLVMSYSPIVAIWTPMTINVYFLVKFIKIWKDNDFDTASQAILDQLQGIAANVINGVQEAPSTMTTWTKRILGMEPIKISYFGVDTLKFLKDDNVWIPLKLAAISGFWSSVYIKQVAKNADMDHMAILNGLYENRNELHSGGLGLDSLAENRLRDLIDDAPCEGIWSYPVLPIDTISYVPLIIDTLTITEPTAAVGWHSVQRLNHPGLAYSGEGEPFFRGEYPGLDFMLLYNLHRIKALYSNEETPVYAYSTNCHCTEEVIVDGAVVGQQRIVNRKFPEYKEMGIPTPKYLAHSVDFTSGASILMQNDLTICRSHDSIQTVLNFYDNSFIHIEGGNKLLVRKGNVLNFVEGSRIEIESDPKSEIVLEDEAVLHFSQGAFLLADGDMRIHLGKNAQFIIEEGYMDCSALPELLKRFTFEEGAQLIMSDSWAKGSMAFDFLSHNQVVLNNSTIQITTTGFISTNLYSHVEMNASTILVQDNAKVQLLSNSDLFYNSGSSLLLNGNETALWLISSYMHIPDGETFAITADQGPVGVVHFQGYAQSETMDLGNDAHFILQGEGVDDLILVVDAGGILWTDNGTAFTSLSKGKVIVNQNGQISVSTRFEASDVSFSNTTGHGDVNCWWNTSVLARCTWDKLAFNGYAARLVVDDNSFNGVASGVKMSVSGVYTVRTSSFADCGINSSSMAHTCLVSNTAFDRGYISDRSIVELALYTNTFANQFTTSPDYAAVYKEDGITTLRCNDFLSNNAAVISAKDNVLNMSTTSGAGYNNFDGNDFNLFFNGAAMPSMDKGYNAFNNAGVWNMYGDLNVSCNTTTIFGRSNLWPPSTIAHPEYFPDQFNEVKRNCDGLILLINKTPEITHMDCIEQRPFVKPGIFGKSAVNRSGLSQIEASVQHELRDLIEDATNPVLDFGLFNNVPLDSALGMAAWYMENYSDSLGNDATAVDMFYDILSSGLDRTNLSVRSMMNWGQENMKSSIERMFVDHELSEEANQNAFETPVQKYVEVLNLMTDTELTDSTYKDQFRVELNKGQLFHTINKPEIARQIFIHLSDCTVDSMQQAQLNSWREQMEIKISAQNQYLDSVRFDSISLTVDTTLYPAPISATVSDYYYGVWINSPNSLTFVNCSSNFHFRNLVLDGLSDATIYPNPASSVINLTTGTANEGLTRIQIYDQSGRLVFEDKQTLIAHQTYSIPLSQQLAVGRYILRLVSDANYEEHSFIIAR